MGKKPVLYLICLGILFFGKTSAQVSINTGLAAYYPFNHSVKDESGNGNHPTGFSISYTTDRFGKPNAACKFNGQTNFIRIPDANSLHFKKGMTISAWVKVEGFYSGECHGNRIIMKGSSDYLNGNFFLTYDDNHYTNGSNCYTSKPDQVHQTFYGPATKPLGKTYVVKGTWYLLTYTYDGNNAILYANCDIVASGKKRNYDFTNYDDLMFGRMENNKFPYWFNGVLDEVRIYNRALNADEVKALCNLQQSSVKPVTDPCDGAGKPSAKFDYTITDCNTVNFRLLTVKNNHIKSIKWFFGDGTTSAETKPVHVYSRFGSFKVKAIVTSKQGCSDTVVKEIKLAGLNTDFVVSEKGEPGMVAFKAKNNKATYAWDFADGSTATNESLISHSYNASGLFTVRMFAKNLVGCTDTVAKSVYILLPKPDSVKESVTETTTVILLRYHR